MDSKHQDKDRIRGLLIKVGDERKKASGNMRGLVSLLQEDMSEHSETIMFSLVEWYEFRFNALNLMSLVRNIYRQKLEYTVRCWVC